MNTYFSAKMAESKEIECLSRLDVVNYLDDLNIKPNQGKLLNPVYKEKYIDFISTYYMIPKSEVPNMNSDLSKIKNWFLANNRKKDRMVKHHESFFNAYIKPKRRAETSTEVCLKINSVLNCCFVI